MEDVLPLLCAGVWRDCAVHKLEGGGRKAGHLRPTDRYGAQGVGTVTAEWGQQHHVATCCRSGSHLACMWNSSMSAVSGCCGMTSVLLPPFTAWHCVHECVYKLWAYLPLKGGWADARHQFWRLRCRAGICENRSTHSMTTAGILLLQRPLMTSYYGQGRNLAFIQQQFQQNIVRPSVCGIGAQQRLI